MKLKKQVNTKKNVGVILITVGTLVLITAAILAAVYFYIGQIAGKRADKTQKKLEKVISETTLSEDGSGMEDLEDGESENLSMPTVEIDGDLYIGYLAVPSLNLKLPVMASWSYEGLKKSPGHYAGSYYQNNLVIAGHNYLRHFTKIKTLPTGSLIEFTDVNGVTRKYRVGWFETIKPKDIKEMCTGDWDMTLFTCSADGTQRVAVRCLLIEDSPDNQNG